MNLLFLFLQMVILLFYYYYYFLLIVYILFLILDEDFCRALIDLLNSESNSEWSLLLAVFKLFSNYKL